MLDDENIYLTADSSVIGTASGDTSYGVQNSARVAFVQVGRISLDDFQDNVTPNIKCNTPLAGDTYTPLCSEETNVYRTMIWEPNDTAHDSKLVNYYNLVCHKRALNGTTYTDQACTDITSGYVPTYTIKKKVTSSENVDIYDGLNYYTSDISLPTETAKSLQNTRTFTDTMKATGGEYTLMKLHPHSVTKIRVYVYLEGQDVDNYDLITNDLDITVNFGFTKERTYTGEIQEDLFFTALTEPLVAEKADLVVGKDLVLVYTDTNTPGYTYNGQMMYDLSELGYKYGETFDYRGYTLTEGIPYSHTYGILIDGNADLSLIEKSDEPAIQIDRSNAVNRYDINNSGIVDKNDADICSKVYNVYPEYFTDEMMPYTLYCDATKDKLIDMSDYSRIIANSSPITFLIDGVTHHATENTNWLSWMTGTDNADNYTLWVKGSDRGTYYLGILESGTNYAYSDDDDAYIFGTGTAIRSIIQMTASDLWRSGPEIIKNHNYVTTVIEGSGNIN